MTPTPTGSCRVAIRWLAVAVTGLAALAAAAAPASGRATKRAPLVVTSAPGRVTVGFNPDRADPSGDGPVMAADQVGALTGGGVLLGDNYRLGHKELDLVALGQDGSLNRQFGEGGLLQVPGLGLYAVVKIAGEADGGALVLAVNQNQINGPQPLALVRVTANGALDHSFAGGGVDRLTGLSGPADFSLEPDGSIVLASTTGANTTSPRVVVTRLAADGAPIPSFGSGGVVNLPQTDEQVLSVALAPDGDIIILANPVTLGQPIMLAALTQSGAFDPAFNGGAPVVVGHDAPSSLAQSADQQLLVQQNGTIELLYSPTTMAFSEPAVSHELFVAAYNPAGTIDTAFGTGGTLKLALGEDASLPAGEEPGTQALLLPGPSGGALVLVPTASDAPRMIRLLATGQADPSLGGASGQVVDLGFGGAITGEGNTGGGADFGETAAKLPDGALVLAGTVELAYFSGAGSGQANTFVTHDAVGALTESLERDSSFGAHGTRLRLRGRVTGTLRHSVTVQLTTSQAAALSARLTAGGVTIARASNLLLYDEKSRGRSLALTRQGAHELRAGRRIHATLTITAIALDGETRTLRIAATIT